MSKKILSLCIAEESLSQTEETIKRLLRVADYSENSKRIEKCMNLNWEDPYGKQRIGRDPNEVRQIGEVGFWEWYPREDRSDRQISTYAGDSFYELKTINEIDVLDEELFISALKNGIEIPYFYAGNLLINIKEFDDFYHVAQIDKAMVEHTNNGIKIRDAVKSINIIKLGKSDFIVAEDRSFYCYTDVFDPAIVKVIKTKRAEDILKDYLRLFRDTYSKKDFSNAKELLEKAFSNIDDIRRLFSSFEYDKNETELAISHMMDIIDLYCADNNGLDAFVNYIYLNKPEIKSELLLRIKTEWHEEQNQEKKRIKAEIESLQREKTLIAEERKSIRAEIKKLTQDKNKGDTLLDELNKSISNRTEKIREAISSVYVSEVIKNELSSKKAGINDSVKPTYKIGTKTTTEDAKDIIDIEDVKDNLAENVKEIGVIEKDAKSVADILFSAACNLKPIIISKIISEKAADALAFAVDGSYAARVLLFDDAFCANDLIDQINALNQRVIHVSGGICTIDETKLINIVDGCSEKQFVFSVPYDRQLKYLPNEILNYFVFINLSNTLKTIESNPSFVASRISLSILKDYADAVSCGVIKELNLINRICGNNYYGLSREKMISNISQLTYSFAI